MFEIGPLNPNTIHKTGVVNGTAILRCHFKQFGTLYCNLPNPLNLNYGMTYDPRTRHEASNDTFLLHFKAEYGSLRKIALHRGKIQARDQGREHDGIDDALTRCKSMEQTLEDIKGKHEQLQERSSYWQDTVLIYIDPFLFCS